MGARGASTASERVEGVADEEDGEEEEEEEMSASAPVFFSIWGGCSVVLCFPVVQGGIVRNSSKVRTRGLQHFHPFCPSWKMGGPGW